MAILPSSRQKQGADISAALREILLARAEGKMSAEEFERRQAELHASLLEAPQQNKPSLLRHWRWVVPALVVIIAIPPIVLYSIYGKSKEPGVTPAPVSMPALSMPETKPQSQQPQANSGGDLNMVVKRLADKMAKDPSNGEGWLLLARTYTELRQHKEAANAYAKADALLPPDAGSLAEWADARVQANELKWDDQSREIVKLALSADPKHLKALALAGSEAFYRADYKEAVNYWKRMQAAAPAGSADAKLAEMNIQEAMSMLSGKKPR